MRPLPPPRVATSRPLSPAPPPSLASRERSQLSNASVLPAVAVDRTPTALDLGSRPPSTSKSTFPVPSVRDEREYAGRAMSVSDGGAAGSNDQVREIESARGGSEIRDGSNERGGRERGSTGELVEEESPRRRAPPSTASSVTGSLDTLLASSDSTERERANNPLISPPPLDRSRGVSDLNRPALTSEDKALGYAEFSPNAVISGGVLGLPATDSSPIRSSRDDAPGSKTSPPSHQYYHTLPQQRHDSPAGYDYHAAESAYSNLQTSPGPAQLGPYANPYYGHAPYGYAPAGYSPSPSPAYRPLGPPPSSYQHQYPPYYYVTLQSPLPPSPQDYRPHSLPQGSSLPQGTAGFDPRLYGYPSPAIPRGYEAYPSEVTDYERYLYERRTFAEEAQRRMDEENPDMYGPEGAARFPEGQMYNYWPPQQQQRQQYYMYPPPRPEQDFAARPTPPRTYPSTFQSRPSLPRQPHAFDLPPVASTSLARGGLAQAQLRDAVSNRAPRSSSRLAGQPLSPRNVQPKPPHAALHALWAGNVPADATTSELYAFFSSLPVPSSRVELVEGQEGVDLNVTGIESIHVIARSNCAFVNYSSELHLQFAISVSNGESIRPQDPRIKPLVCRVRRGDETGTSGVGIQRQGGLHRTYVAKKLKNESVSESSSSAVDSSPPRISSEGEQLSSGGAWSSSTTSSFLAKHFHTRYFILKAHDEQDLQLSVETGLWATQAHNEPVLDQAFRTSRDVILIFGANKKGEWFGYARMAGPILSPPKAPTVSVSSRGDPTGTLSEQATPLHETVIPEGGALADFPPRPTMLFSKSEDRLEGSPLPMTPSGQHLDTDHPPPAMPTCPPARSAPSTLLKNLHIPEEATASTSAPTRRSSLDPNLLRATEEISITPTSSSEPTVERGTTASERNSNLERRVEPERARTNTAFKVDWIKVVKVPFMATRHIKNSFNEDREVKVSRDGTEVEPIAGDLLLAEFARADPTESSPSTGTQDSPAQDYNPYFPSSPLEHLSH